jgi:cell division protein FtsI/penicillin-binding protein 2
MMKAVPRRSPATGILMAGKTGTAQVRRISRAERRSGVLKNEERPWAERDHALFVGYAPLDRPKLAVAIVVEHGGSGSKAAAPIARDVMVEALGIRPRLPVGRPLAAGPGKPAQPVANPDGRDRS